MDEKGLLRTSLVLDPAIKQKLMAFSEEADPMRFLDEEQQIIFAPALIPNQKIFRKSIKGEPAEVYFDAETIKDLHIRGSRHGYDSKINLNHEEANTEGVFCFENWIVEDEKLDKAYKMGFEVPVGTLMKGYKIDNPDVWAKVKSGEITGLSIEAYLDTIEDETLNFNNQQMNKKSVWEHIKSLFAGEDSKEYATGYFGQSLEEGSIITDAEGNAKPNETFEYEGKKYTTDDMGAISKIEAIDVEDLKDDGEDWEKRVADLEAENAELKAKLTEWEAKASEDEKTKMSAEKSIEEKDNEIAKLKSELIELKEIPKAPAFVEDSEYQKRLQKMKKNRGL
jgi:hypothetical protein